MVVESRLDSGVTVYQLLGAWRPLSLRAGARLLGELYEKYSKSEEWMCERYGLEFECRDGEGRILRGAWIPETRRDIEDLLSMTRG